MQRREFWEHQLHFFPFKLHILFPLSKIEFYRKIVWNVYYRISPYIVGELTVNYLKGFSCSIFTVFYR